MLRGSDMTDVMLEQKSRLSILVVEDNAEFSKNAVEGLLKENNLSLVGTLEDAMELCFEAGQGRRAKFDFILSDAHVPVKHGSEPVPVVSEIVHLAYGSSIPLCFVTRADHHGLIDEDHGDHITLKAAGSGDIAVSLLKISAVKEPSQKEVFRLLEGANESVKSDSKSPEIWGKALQMLQNRSTRSSPLGIAINKMRETGVDVRFEDGMPRVIPAKMKK